MPPPDGLWSPNRRALTAGLVSTITLIAFEALAIATVMPVVAEELGRVDLYGWVFSAFLLSSLLGIVIAGLMIDRGGLVRPFLAGLALFAAGLIVAGAAPTMEILVIARFAQGLGAGAVPPIAYVAIGRALPEGLRPLMFATLSTAWVVPGLIGPWIAGVVADALHWRLVFLGLLPILAVAGLVTVRALQVGVPDRPPSPDSAEHRAAAASARRLPLAVLLVVGAAALIAGLTGAEPPLAVGLVGVGAVVTGFAFARLTPPGTLVARRGLPAAVILRGVLTFAFFAADLYVALALVSVRGLKPAEAGLALTAATLSWTAGSWIQARNARRFSARAFVASGFGIVTLGIAAFGLVLLPGTPVVIGVAVWAVVGLGMGLSYSPLALVVLRDAAPEAQGAATSALQLSDVLGTALGAGIGGALVAAGERAGDLALGLAGAFVVAAAVAAAGFLASPRLGSRDGRPMVTTEARPEAAPPPEPETHG